MNIYGDRPLGGMYAIDEQKGVSLKVNDTHTGKISKSEYARATFKFFQSIMLRKLLDPSDTKLILEQDGKISTMELIINHMLHSLLNCKEEENHVGLFESLLKTAFGLPDQTKYLRYEVGELVPIVQQAMDILNRKEL